MPIRSCACSRLLRLCLLSLSIGVAMLGGSVATAGVVLVADQRPQAVIVVPDAVEGQADWSNRSGLLPPSVEARQAAELLNFYLEKAGGVRLPVVTASQTPPTGTLLLIGKSEASDLFELPRVDKPEQVLIAPIPRGLVIMGEVAPRGTHNIDHPYDRGTAHAVSVFLERYLGYRFYFNHGDDPELGTVTPDLSGGVTVDIEQPFTAAPAFAHRQLALEGWGWQAATLKGRGNLFRCNHTDVGWDRSYKESHPEYFALTSGGERDWTSLCYGNPAVLDQALDHVEDYFNGEKWIGERPPTDTYIQVEPVDNWAECQDPQCQKWIDDTQGRFNRHSRLWWDHYLHHFAEQAEKRWPRHRVSSLAYQQRLWPGRKQLPDNVDVMVCLHQPVGFYKEAEAREHTRKLLSAWSEQLGHDRERLYVWDYFCWPQFWTCAPTIYPNLMQAFLQENRDRISGMFLNMGGETIQGAHYMVDATMALLWDPQLDTQAHLRDYCEKFYGPAAEPMREFYTLLIDRYESTRWQGGQSVGYASPVAFYGQTYPLSVVERAEQWLWEAQREVGALPEGRFVDFDGEGWFVRRNGADAERVASVTLEAIDQPIVSPVLRWDGGYILYQGVIERGQKLVIDAGAARLIPTQPPPPREWIPAAQRNLDAPVAFDQGYTVQAIRNLNVAAIPGSTFELSVEGKAEGGADSLVGVQWSDGRWTYVLDSQFSEEMRVRRVEFQVPDGVQALNHVYLFRRNKTGVVWYGNLSLKRQFPVTDSALPTDGLDVSSRVVGSVPVFAARTTLRFHAFSGNTRLRIDDSSKTFFDPPDNAVVGSASGSVLRVAVDCEPVGASGSATADAAAEASLYQRRVGWMRDHCENFHPQTSMYRPQDGFFVAARTAYPWLKQPPVYRVSRSQAQDIHAAAWQDAEKMSLVRGRSKAKVPLENLGFEAGTSPTTVSFLRGPDALYARFVCDRSGPADQKDAVGLTLYTETSAEPIFTMAYDSATQHSADQEGVVAEAKQTEAGWEVQITIPWAALGGAPRGAYPVDVVREFGGEHYLLSPALDAPWVEMPSDRRAKLDFGAGR